MFIILRQYRCILCMLALSPVLWLVVCILNCIQRTFNPSKILCLCVVVSVKESSEWTKVWLKLNPLFCPLEDPLYAYVIDDWWAVSVAAKFTGLIHRLKILQGIPLSLTHSMQLVKNNNAMWRVISNGDQPLPHLLRSLTSATTENVNLGPKTLLYHYKACVYFQSCLISWGLGQWKC